MDKVLAIWKPKDMTSFDVVKKIQKFIPNEKIGHCGTLDPFAQGILIICIGKYTKDVAHYMNHKKKYIATIKLGSETDTLDLTGKIIKESNKKNNFNENNIIKILNKFKGTINQIPPYFSAKKINGIKLYTFARKDIFIRKKSIPVQVHDINLLSFSSNKLIIDIECGKGTYIRSLGRDIAYSLNTYGYLHDLSRVCIGEFNENNSIKYEDIKNVFRA